MTDTHVIKCGKCRVPMEGPKDPQPQDVLTCPACGQHETFENVMKEVEEYIAEAVEKKHGDSLDYASRGSEESPSFERDPDGQKSYRFIVDLDA